MFCFAGHGREGDGAVYCDDGALLTPDELSETLAQEADLTNRAGRLLVSAVLDSCHSGAFTTGLLDACLRSSFDLLNRSDYAGVAYKDASGPRKG